LIAAERLMRKKMTKSWSWKRRVREKKKRGRDR
jgi:hypothetical protein